MPSDIHDPSPAKARRLRIVRTVMFWTALLLFLAGIIGGLAVAVWGDRRIRQLWTSSGCLAGFPSKVAV